MCFCLSLSMWGVFALRVYIVGYISDSFDGCLVPALFKIAKFIENWVSPLELDSRARILSHGGGSADTRSFLPNPQLQLGLVYRQGALLIKHGKHDLLF